MRNNIKPSPVFVSGHSKAQWVMVFLAITIILAIVAIVSDYLQLDLISRAMEGQIITEAEANSNDYREQLIHSLQQYIFIFTGILFLRWIYYSHRNLPALGARNLKYTPGWAIGGFFVPFLNLVRPLQVMREIWKASDPKADVKNGSSWESAPLSPLVGWWWALFLIGNLVMIIAVLVVENEKSINSLYTSTWLRLISEVIYIIAALVTILLAKAIYQRQDEKHKSENLFIEHGVAEPTQEYPKICGLAYWSLFMVIFPYVGLPMSIFALRKITRSDGALRGKGIAWTAFALNLIILGAMILSIWRSMRLL